MKKLSASPIKTTDLSELSTEQLVNLIFSAGERALQRRLSEEEFPTQELERAISSKRKWFSGKRDASSLKREIQALKSLFPKIHSASYARSTIYHHFDEVFPETFYLILKIVQLRIQRPDRFRDAIVGTLSQASLAAREYARYRKKDRNSAWRKEIRQQRHDLAALRSE